LRAWRPGALRWSASSSSATVSAAAVSRRVGGGEQRAAYAGDGLVLAVVLLCGDEGHEPFKGPGVALQSRLQPSVSGRSGAGARRCSVPRDRQAWCKEGGCLWCVGVSWSGRSRAVAWGSGSGNVVCGQNAKSWPCRLSFSALALVSDPLKSEI
jgi:hypothetical protein